MILKEVKKPTEGDLMAETMFAWFPTWVDNKKIWLQKYQRFYEYGWFTPCYPGPPFPCIGWHLIGEKVLFKSKPTQ
jgi:hypothetical protein